MNDPHLSWNVLRDVTQLFDFPFMVNAFRAGTIVAVTAAIVGWFMVLRRQSFAGHTLALVGFPGASGAILIGLSATYGFFAFAIGCALVISAFSQPGRGHSEESAVIGTVQAFALASGFLFVSLSRRNITGVQALLFGSFTGITSGQVALLFVGAVVVLFVVAIAARPLMFASVDPDVAAARGVPVRALSLLFLIVLAVAAAEASQITGSLLVFALLVLPPATAGVLVSRPSLSLAVAVVLALFVTWLGLAMSYYDNYPIGFHITSLAFGAYALSRASRGLQSIILSPRAVR